MDALPIVNPVPVEQVEPWLTMLGTALLDNPFTPAFRRRVEIWRRRWDAERTWGVRADGRWVATLATDDRTVTVPGFGGGTVPVRADALTGVSVSATHRRQGLLTRMITASLSAARERGDALGVLIAAEWPIYGRFGYAPAARGADYTYFPRRRGATISPTGDGVVRQLEPAELAPHAARVFDGVRAQRAGQLSRDADWWAAQLGLADYGAPEHRPYWFVHEGTDGVDGIVSWRPTRDFELDGRLGAAEVGQLLAATPQAYRNLWAYLAGIDVMAEIKLANRPLDEPARWLLGDGRALRQGYTGDVLWLRILDLPAALSARGYAVPGRLVLDVVDDSPGGYATGRVLLEASDTEASCRPSTEAPDLRLTQRALAAAYLGDHSLRTLATGGGVEELRPGALGRADAMFATGLAPWNATWF